MFTAHKDSLLKSKNPSTTQTPGTRTIILNQSHRLLTHKREGRGEPISSFPRNRSPSIYDAQSIGNNPTFPCPTAKAALARSNAGKGGKTSATRQAITLFRDSSPKSHDAGSVPVDRRGIRPKARGLTSHPQKLTWAIPLITTAIFGVAHAFP